MSAAVIYAALVKDDLEWIGLADRGAGIADDVVLGLPARIVGHQFKMSRFASPFRVESFLMGADGLLKPLAVAWQALKRSHPGKAVEIRLVTNDIPSINDKLSGDNGSHSAAWVMEFDSNPARSLAEWRASKWQVIVDKFFEASSLSQQEFDQFLHSLKILCGSAADFVHTNRLTPGDA